MLIVTYTNVSSTVVYMFIVLVAVVWVTTNVWTLKLEYVVWMVEKNVILILP